MATGITNREKHGRDAINAACPLRHGRVDLPEYDDHVRLQYPNRMDRKDVLAPIKTDFYTYDRNSRSNLITHLAPDVFVLADNLYVLHNLLQTRKRATLIYLDPPYGTGLEFQSRQLEHAYKDDKSPATYLEYLRRRLILMRELLSQDGSIYLHIGHKMLFHVKVIMDEIFGPRNFRNIIVRRTCNSKNYTRKTYPDLHDYILFYTKSSSYKWNRPIKTPNREWVEKEYPKTDARGRYKLVPLHAPGTRHGQTGQKWRGISPPPGKHWQYIPDKMDEIERRGEIYWSRNGNPRRKIYLAEDKTVPLTTLWDGFRDAHHQSVKITGYPTEKNLEMLRVIVAAATDPGDLVIDPFCGSGTALHAADDLDRRWVGVDASFTAARATITRLRHGLREMGIFVHRETRESTTPSMFPDDNNRLPRQKKQPNPPRSDRRFLFAVHSTLLSSYESEIGEISKI